MMIMHHTYIGMNLRLALNSQNLNSAKLERMYDVMCLLNGNLIILCNLMCRPISDLLVIVFSSSYGSEIFIITL